MKSRVFVSCGQRDDDEKRVGREVCALLEERGFSAYLAIDVQTILEINGGIIRELKNSDCYLFVNFPRELVRNSNGQDFHRGSLFSNQELAIAYALQFAKLLIVNQKDVKPEGMLGYIGVNTETFNNQGDCVDVVKRALDRAGWTPDYSRRLRAANLRFQRGLLTYGNLTGWFLYLDINNHRPDIAALESTARLSGYTQEGQEFQPSIIRSPLKASGRPGFSHTIFPKSHETFDLLCIGTDAAAGANARCQVHLNSAYDVAWACPLPVTAGAWTFRYEFVALEFPMLTVEIQLAVPQGFPEHGPPSARLIAQAIS